MTLFIDTYAVRVKSNTIKVDSIMESYIQFLKASANIG